MRSEAAWRMGGNIIAGALSSPQPALACRPSLSKASASASVMSGRCFLAEQRPCKVVAESCTWQPSHELACHRHELAQIASAGDNLLHHTINSPIGWSIPVAMWESV